MKVDRFNTGETVPHSGIYRVIHAHHRLPHEVTLLAGETFPRCSKCQDAVQFEVVRQADMIEADRNFRIIVYELPAQEEDDTPKPIAS